MDEVIKELYLSTDCIRYGIPYQDLYLFYGSEWVCYILETYIIDGRKYLDVHMGDDNNDDMGPICCECGRHPYAN